MPDNPFDKPRSDYDNAYSNYLEASQRFDYFVAGISIAIVGYLGSRFTATPIGWNASTVELASLISLLASAFSGLKRVQTIVYLLKSTQQHIREVDSAAAFTEAATAGQTAIDYAAGQALSARDLAVRGETHRGNAESYKKLQQDLGVLTSRWSLFRDRLLIFGLSLLILARLVAAYH